MLKPKDVFVDFETFCDWWCDVLPNGKDGLRALVYWMQNLPCVPGSYSPN